MSRLFGTDGIRGVANVDLKPTMAYALGRATAKRLVEPGGSIVVGQDTRRSGDMFVAAITAGATSLGVDVHVVGVVPTPALAFLARTGPYQAGIMVSASHNPADDNGLKVLDSEGLKLDDAIEEELEALIWREGELGGVGNAQLGRSVDAAWAVEEYLDHRLGLAESIDASGLHIVLDGANGSGGIMGPEILEATGARVEAIHVEPDGININVESGATSPGSLAVAVGGTWCGRRIRARRRRGPPDRGRWAGPRRGWGPGLGHPRARAPRTRRAAGRARGVDPVQRRAATRRRGGRW